MASRKPFRTRHARRLRFRDRRLTLGRLFYFVLDKGSVVILALALYVIFNVQVKR